jgi:hypothetical protein
MTVRHSRRAPLSARPANRRFKLQWNQPGRGVWRDPNSCFSRDVTETAMACPYFVPDERCEAELWQHRARLPLGDAYCGTCRAPGHEGVRPTDDEVRTCNVGYPRHCSRAPEDRAIDAVRFAVASDDGAQVVVRYSCERAHRPAGNGELRFAFEQGSARCAADPAQDWLLPLARSYVNAYLARNPRP